MPSCNLWPPHTFWQPPTSCLTTTYKDLLSRLLLFVISPSCYSLSHILLFLIFSGRHLLTVCAKDNFERIDTTEISQNSLSTAALEAYAFVIRFIFANWCSIPVKVYVVAMPNLLLSASVTLWLISKKERKKFEILKDVGNIEGAQMRKQWITRWQSRYWRWTEWSSYQLNDLDLSSRHPPTNHDTTS